MHPRRIQILVDSAGYAVQVTVAHCAEHTFDADGYTTWTPPFGQEPQDALEEALLHQRPQWTQLGLFRGPLLLP